MLMFDFKVVPTVNLDVVQDGQDNTMRSLNVNSGNASFTGNSNTIENTQTGNNNKSGFWANGNSQTTKLTQTGNSNTGKIDNPDSN